MDSLARRIWTVVGAIAALLIGAGAWMIIDARTPAPTEPSLAAKPRHDSALAPTAAVQTLPAPVRGDESPASMVAKMPDGFHAVEVCGARPLQVAERDLREAFSDGLLAALAQVAPPPWGAMQASADERIRAAGHAMAGHHEALAKLAMSTKDPAVIAAALAACRHVADQARAAEAQRWCDAVSARQWAVLEPENGSAWLALLAQAQPSADAGDVEEALHRLSHATRFSDEGYFVVEQMQRHQQREGLPGAAGRQESPWLYVAYRRADTVWERGLSAHCLADPTMPVQRKTLCLDAAQAMHERSASIEHRWQASNVAKRLTNDAPEWVQRERTDAAVWSVTTTIIAQATRQPYACASLRHVRSVVRASVEEGSWRAMHRMAQERYGSEASIMAESERLRPLRLRPLPSAGGHGSPSPEAPTPDQR